MVNLVIKIDEKWYLNSIKKVDRNIFFLRPIYIQFRFDLTKSLCYNTKGY